MKSFFNLALLLALTLCFFSSQAPAQLVAMQSGKNANAEAQLTPDAACSMVKDHLPRINRLEIYKSMPLFRWNKPEEKLDIRLAAVTANGLLFSSADGHQLRAEYATMKMQNNLANSKADMVITFFVDKQWWEMHLSNNLKLREAYKDNKQFFDALNRMIALDKLHLAAKCGFTRTPLDQFKEQTITWRTMENKNPLSDAVTKKRLLAEDAYQNRDFAKAADYYEQGTAIDPTWAQGWFNAAYLYAELQQYSDAADCIQRYLFLLPNAPDADAAKDKLLLWQAKTEETAPAQQTVSNTTQHKK